MRSLRSSRFLLVAYLLFASLPLTTAQTLKHPCLIYTPDRIREARERTTKDVRWAEAWQTIKKKADESLNQNNFLNSEYLALAYAVTGENRYAEKAKELLINSLSGKSWSSSGEMQLRKPAWNSDLGLSHKCGVAAKVYDVLYPILSPAERKDLAQRLYTQGVLPSLGDWLLEPTRIHTINSMGHNWWSSCTGMGGLLALSISNEIPGAAQAADELYDVLPEWFGFAGDVLQNKPQSFDESGGMYESVNYASFGISEALTFRLAWQNAHPQAAHNEIPQLAAIPDFFIHTSYPRQPLFYSLNFGDGHSNVTGENALMMLYALGIKDPDILWYIRQVSDNQHRESNSRFTPMGFLYLPDLQNAPKSPSRTFSRVFSQMGWATFRDSWNPNATLLAVKSGHTWNHAHADAASFVLYQNGERLLKDAGNCSYPNPPYKDYFFQSQAHNVVLFDGEGQPTSQQYEGSMLDGALSGQIDAGNIRYILANATGPTAKNFQRNFRHLIWIDRILYVADDLKTYQAGNFEWLWHTEGTVRKNGIDLLINNGKAAAVLRPVYPEYLAPSAFLQDYPSNLYLEEKQGPTEDLKGTETYYSFHYPVQTRQLKGLTMVILRDSASTLPLPETEKTEGKDWIGLKVQGNDTITELFINKLSDGTLMHSNSWISANGWETDAALTVVRYLKNAPDHLLDFLVVYGSALRKNGTPYFGSLSKLNLVYRSAKDKTEIFANGQSTAKMRFYSPERPAAVFFNGNKTKAEYQNKSLILRLQSDFEKP